MFYAGKEHNDNVEHFAHNQNDAVNSNLTSQLKQQLTIGTFLVFFLHSANPSGAGSETSLNKMF